MTRDDILKAAVEHYGHKHQYVPLKAFCKGAEWMLEQKNKEIEQLKQKVYTEFENFLRIRFDHQQHGNLLREEDFQSFLDDFKQAMKG